VREKDLPLIEEATAVWPMRWKKKNKEKRVEKEKIE